MAKRGLWWVQSPTPAVGIFMALPADFMALKVYGSFWILALPSP